MKTGVYYRVSTDRQDLESQRVTVEAWLAAKGLDEKDVVVFSDEGFSGKDSTRPGFRALVAAAMRGSIKTVVVYRLDRLSRDAGTAIRTILELDAAGVGFVAVTQPVLNLGNDVPFRRTILAAFAEIAEIERDTIVARVRSGLDAARKRGVKLGRPATDQTLVDRAGALFAGGASVRAVARELGISTGVAGRIAKERKGAAGVA